MGVALRWNGNTILFLNSKALNHIMVHYSSFACSSLRVFVSGVMPADAVCLIRTTTTTGERDMEIFNKQTLNVYSTCSRTTISGLASVVCRSLLISLHFAFINWPNTTQPHSTACQALRVCDALHAHAHAVRFGLYMDRVCILGHY